MPQHRHLLRFWRVVLSLLLAAPLLAAGAKPGIDKANWDNLKQLARNEQIRIVLQDAKAYRGEFQSVSDEDIVVRVTTGLQTFPRNTVLRVSTKGASHAGRNALIGAAIGAGAGAVAVAATCQTTECKGPVEAIVGIPVGAPLGALVGFLMPTGGWHDLYRAR